MSDAEHIDKPEVFFRSANTGDGARMWSFVKKHGVLELNSAYSYMLMATHFGQHCMIAETAEQADTNVDKQLVGFVLSYRPPEHEEDIFVWQIGVDPAMRGRGLAKRMLQQLLVLPRNRGVRYVTATVARDNEPSRALFRGFARDSNVSCEETDFFTPDMFPRDLEGGHEAEDLFRIGPLDSAGATEHV